MYYLLKILLIALDRLLGTFFIVCFTPLILVGLLIFVFGSWIWKFKVSEKVRKLAHGVWYEYILNDLWNGIRFKLSGVEFIARSEDDE